MRSSFNGGSFQRGAPTTTVVGLLLLLASISSLGCVAAFTVRTSPKQSTLLQIRGGASSFASTSTATFVVGPAAASVLAGSVAGAIGVGVAFPLDTLKTKAQVMSQQARADSASSGSTGSAATATATQLGMFQVISLVWKQEGVAGFFGGVRGMMAGQAVIKALAFSANAAALGWLQQQAAVHAAYLPATVLLLGAAFFAGFITSFVVAPIERIKVMMQASASYRNEWHCIQVILETEGWQGLFSRGLGPTLAREIPSYGLYFWTYGFLTSMFDLGPALSPLVFGAMAGMAAWVPVYPIDVVKTLVQNTDGKDEQESAWQVMREVYAQGGVGAFFDGLTPKLLRAAVNHAVTFFIYDLLMQRFGH